MAKAKVTTESAGDTKKKKPAAKTAPALPPATFDDLVRAIDRRASAFASAWLPAWGELGKCETALIACTAEAIAKKGDVAAARAFVPYAKSEAEHARGMASFARGLARRGDRDAAAASLRDAEFTALDSDLGEDDRATAWGAIARGWRALGDASGVDRALGELDAVHPGTDAIAWSRALEVVADALSDVEDLDRYLSLVARCDPTARHALAPTLVRCIATCAGREDFARLQALLDATKPHSNRHELALEGLRTAASRLVREERIDTARQLLTSWPHERDSSFEHTLRRDVIGAACDAGHTAFAKEVAEGGRGAPCALAELLAAAGLPAEARTALDAQEHVDQYSARGIARAAALLGDAPLVLKYAKLLKGTDLTAALRDTLRLIARGDAAAVGALHEGALKALAKAPGEERARGLAELGIACAARGDRDGATTLLHEAIEAADGAEKGWKRNLVLRDLAGRFAETGHAMHALLAYKKCAKSDKPSVAALLAYGAARAGDLATALAMIDAIDPGTTAPAPGPDLRLPRAWQISLFVACDLAHELAGTELPTSVRRMFGTL